MCVDFPGQIVERDGETVIVDTEGRRRRASTLLIPTVAVGDWVYVAAGTVIEVLDPDEAAQIRRELSGAATEA
jgi:hydrogenase assembly chaperone HypC/HupF